MAAHNSLLELTDVLLRLHMHTLRSQNKACTPLRGLSCSSMSTCTDVKKARKKFFALSRGFHHHALLWNSMSRGFSSRVVMSGCFVQKMGIFTMNILVSNILVQHS